MIHYDNLDDVKTKLYGTCCYYQNKAVLVKGVNYDAENDKLFTITVIGLNSRQLKLVKLDDPELNFMRFNLGYSNHSMGSVWWYRIPNKQYRQGLKSDQLGCSASREDFRHRVEFGFSKPVVDMMENVYPHFDESEKLVKTGESMISAFHRDFAVTYDRVHQDMILEYKGKAIGCMNNSHNVKLMDEYKHLEEAFKEAMA